MKLINKLINELTTVCIYMSSFKGFAHFAFPLTPSSGGGESIQFHYTLASGNSLSRPSRPHKLISFSKSPLVQWALAK